MTASASGVEVPQLVRTVRASDAVPRASRLRVLGAMIERMTVRGCGGGGFVPVAARPQEHRWHGPADFRLLRSCKVSEPPTVRSGDWLAFLE